MVRERDQIKILKMSITKPKITARQKQVLEELKKCDDELSGQDLHRQLHQGDKAMGIMANGVLLHTPEWGQDGNPPPGFTIDAVKYPYIKNNNAYDAVLDNQVYY